MIVCHCHAINDRIIRDIVRAGAGSPRAVARACGAGAGCGGCRHAVERIIESEQCARSESMFSQESMSDVGLARAG
jgi:bacterioferritin-associated ferredoxin